MGSIALSDWVAVIGLLMSIIAISLSCYATFTTRDFNKRQLSLIESQEELNKRQIERDAADAILAKKANCTAEYVRLMNEGYRLRVSNRGQAVARNVRIEFLDGIRPVIESEIENKFPLKSLEPGCDVDLVAADVMGMPVKQRVILRWADDFADERTNDFEVFT